MRRRWWIGIGVAAGLAALLAVAVVFLRQGEPPSPAREADRYLRAWERFDGPAMVALTGSPEVGPLITGMKEALSVTAARFTAADEERDGDTARVPFTAELDLAVAGTWSYSGSLDLAREDGRWRVQWSPAAVHPELRSDLRFSVTLSWQERAPILGHDGTPLVATGEVIVVGLQPSRIVSHTEVEEVLQRVLAVEPAAVRAALAQPWVRPEFFVPVAEVRPERFTSLRSQLEPVPGVFFQRGRARVAPTDGLTGHVLGTVGEITAERLAELGAPYAVGDRVGLSGIEAAFERKLAGTPSGEVQLVDVSGSVAAVLHRFAGAAPQPVRLTLERAVQQAAEQALAGVNQPGALVAIDSASGDLRAVVSRPSEEFNRGLAGTYPPGSTFKIVTTAALLAAGVRPEEAVTCPAQVSAGGRPFVNFESGALGSVPFSTAFAQSCNTAFVSLATSRLDGSALARAAASFGFGSRYDLGLPVGGGQFPAPADGAELASAAIGQGRVLASPVHMASVAAAVANGSWRAPRLNGEAPTGEVKPLDPAVAATLRQLMTAVVREGSATAAARPGQEVAGKTGTAEFGTANPPPTHAWFVGFRGTLAFAVLVEGGGVGGRVAAPIAARFLDAAPR